MKPLIDAIRAGDTAAVSALLDGDPALADARDEHGVAALAIAMYNGKPEIAELLRSRGAKLDLYLAAMTGDSAALDRELPGTDVNAPGADGWTPLHLAAFFGRESAARRLLEAGAEVDRRSTNAMANTPLHAAAAGRATDVVRLLLERGAAVNARQHGGWTALQSAAQSGNIDLARLLIAAGAEVGARADNGQCALDLALLRGDKAMVELLESYG